MSRSSVIISGIVDDFGWLDRIKCADSNEGTANYLEFSWVLPRDFNMFSNLKRAYQRQARN